MEKTMLYNIYFSPTGGTKKVADILAGNLGGEVCEVDICCDIEKMSLQADDFVWFRFRRLRDGSPRSLLNG